MTAQEFLALVADSCEGGRQAVGKITARFGGVEGFLDSPADSDLAMLVSQQIGNAVGEPLREEAQTKLRALCTEHDLLLPATTTAPR